MAKVKVKMNGAGAAALLRSPAVAADLKRRADAVAERACSMAGPDGMPYAPYEADVHDGYSRARATVYARSRHGAYDNAKYNTLLRSLDAGR